MWGGDPDCVHEWGDEILVNATNHTDKRRWQHTRNGRDEEQPKEKRVGWLRSKVGQGAHCLRCGAWRGTLGNEPTPELFVAHLVEVFREVRRVLRDDGTVWLNLGDSYWGGKGENGNSKARATAAERGYKQAKGTVQVSKRPQDGRHVSIKPKDLIGIPWLTAFALRADGWYLRGDIIWAKGVSFCSTYAGSSMPESVTDRPSRTHEYLFLLSKSAKYFYDTEAVKESVTSKKGNARSFRGGGAYTKGQSYENSQIVERETRGNAPNIEGSRNLRSVWTINPKPYPGAHFATFSPALVTPCIKAGTSEYGACAACGQPYRRYMERGAPRVEQQQASGANRDGGYDGKQAGHGRRHAGFNERYFAKVDYEEAGAQDPGAAKASILAGMVEKRTIGWAPDCTCDYPDLPTDSFELIGSPTTESEKEPDPTMHVGRAGFSRRRADDEGKRLITRYEQREYAQQLRESPHRAEIEAIAGDAFSHYIRVDRSGARPLPPSLLNELIAWGWLTRVDVPPRRHAPPVPCVVLDPFSGSGTTAATAHQLGRIGIGIEPNPEYVVLGLERLESVGAL